jgi:hypothetical protein
VSDARSKHVKQIQREKVVAAVLGYLSAQAQHDLAPGSYGAMASAEMADDLLDEALTEYVEVCK